MLASISGQSKSGPSTKHSQSSDIIPTVPLPPSSTKHSSPKLASRSGQSKPGPSTKHSQSSDIVPSTPSFSQGSPMLASISGQSKVSSFSQLTNTVKQIAIRKIK